MSTEQEYDTQPNASHSMLDQPEPDQDRMSDPDHSDHHRHSLHGTYPPQQQFENPQAGPSQGYQFTQHNQQPGMPPPRQQHPMTPQAPYDSQQQTQQGVSEGEGGQFGTIPHMIDPGDPMLDADPFGLSASMHYPTAYSYDR